MANDDDNSSNSSGTSNRGFAAMDDQKQREIASKGGSASGGNFKNDREKAREAGRKGCQASRRNTLDHTCSDALIKRPGHGAFSAFIMVIPRGIEPLLPG